MSALWLAALWSGLATLVVLVASRVWRRTDAAFWHAAWTAIATGSLALPLAGVLLPIATTLAIAGDGPVGVEVVNWATRAASSSGLFTIYLAGLAFSAFRLASGFLLVQRLRRRSEAIEGLPLVRLRQLAPGATSLVRTHRRVQVPLTAGWRSPVVLLPDTWLTWENERIDAVLRHELAHVERGDYVWNLVAECFRAIFWFSPAAWIVSRRIRLTAELAADRAASDDMGRVPYARILVESARELLRGRAPGMLAPGAATVLEARVAALTGMPDDLPSTSRRTRRLAAVLIAALLLSSSFVRFSPGPPSPVDDDHATRHAARHRH